MNDEFLKHILTKRAEQEIPATMSIRDKVYQTLSTPTPAKGVSVLRPRLRWAAVLVATLIITASVAIGQGTSIQPDRGVQKIQADNQLVEINQTQSLTVAEPFQNLAITVDYAYADSNRVVIGYHVAGTTTEGVELYSNPTLTDDASHTYMWLPNSAQQVMDTASAGDFTHSAIISFDAAGVTTSPSALNLSLQLDLAYSTAASRADDPYGMFGAGGGSFNFSVPFNAGRTITLDQAVVSGDLTVTVQKVVITPSLTRVDLCLSNLALFEVDAWLSWETPITLDVNGTRIVTDLPATFTGLNGVGLEPNASCRSLAIPDALLEHTGTWALSLNGFQNAEAGQSIAGTWNFTFDVN